MNKKTETIDAEVIEKDAVILAPVTDLMFTNGVDLPSLAKKYSQMPVIDLQAENLGEVYQEYLKGTKEVGKAFNLIEKTRKIVKDPVLQYGRKIDATAKELKAIIEPTKDKLMDGRKLIENEEERKQQEVINAELERQEGIETFINKLNQLPMSAIGKTSLEIQEIINNLIAPTEETCYERLVEAVAIWQNTNNALEGMFEAAVKVENADKIAEEQEAIRVAEAEMAEAKRVAEREEFEAEKRAFEAEKVERAEAEALEVAKQAVDDEVEEQKKAVDETMKRVEEVKEEIANSFYEAYGKGGVDAILEAVFENKINHITWEV